MRIAVCLCLLTLTVAAQSSTPPDNLCSLEGRVVNAVTGEPVKKATVFMSQLTPVSPAYTTVSDATGQFAMMNLEPGRYRLWVERTGFLSGEYGARIPEQRGAELELARGQSTKNVNFRLIPQGIMSGRITDEDGDPVQRAQVQAFRLRYVRGKKQLNAVSRYPVILTNDLGEYRIFGLAPGKYYVAADYRTPASGLQALDRSATPQPQRDYPRAYYPGAVDESTALPVAITAGADVRGIDIRLSRSHTVSIRGRVTNKAVAGHAHINVYLGSESGGGAGYGAAEDGTFEIRRVVPGRYVLQASIDGGGMFYMVRQHIEVHDEDVDNLNLTIVPGVQLEGHLRAEGDREVSLEKLSFNLQTLDGNGGSDAVLKEDKTLHFENVNTGHYYVIGNNLPDGFYIKAVRSGETDVLAAGLEVGSAVPAPFEVVLSSHAGQIAGAVQNPDTQQPAPFSVVVLVPQEKERREQWWYYRNTTADRSGSFTFKSIDPGEYKAYAWDEIEDGAYMDPEFMKPFESKGEPISVKESSQLTDQLTLISSSHALVK